MASSKKIESRMSCKNPETFVFTPECVKTSTLGHVPYSDTLIFRVGENKFLAWMEENT
jgi:hypothetical protein